MLRRGRKIGLRKKLELENAGRRRNVGESKKYYWRILKISSAETRKENGVKEKNWKGLED